MNDKELHALSPNEEHSVVGVRNLRVKKNKNGTASWILMKRMPKAYGEKSEILRITLGVWPDLTLDQAETKCVNYRILISEGNDPRVWEREQVDQANAVKADAQRKSVTLNQLHQEYMRHRDALDMHTDQTKKSMHQVMPQVWEKFWDQKIQEISSEALLDHYEYWMSQRVGRLGKPAKYQMTKGVRYLKAEMSYAIKNKKYLTENPCAVFDQAVRRADQQQSLGKNKNHLSITETEELWDWLGRLLLPDGNMLRHLSKLGLTASAIGLEAQVSYDLVALELLSGARQNEVRLLKWDKVMLDEKDWKEEGADGPFFEVFVKQQREFGLPITSQMRGVFERRLAARTNAYVFPSYRGADGPLPDDGMAWRRLEKLMPPESLRRTKSLSSNVLRHTFATAVDLRWKNVSLADTMTGHYTKHSGGVSTLGYIHMQADRSRDEFQEINDVLTGSLPEEVRLRIQKEFEELEARLDAEGFEKSLDGIAAFRTAHGA